MVDGVSGTELLALLLDLTPETQRHAPVDWNPHSYSSRDVTLDAARSLATDTAEQLRAVRSALRRRHGRSATSPMCWAACARSRAASKPRANRPTGPVGSHRVIAWADAPLADVKSIRTALGGTVNDVVLTAITNGFRELLLSRGESVEGRTVRTLIPVSVRARARTAPPPGTAHSTTRCR